MRLIHGWGSERRERRGLQQLLSDREKEAEGRLVLSRRSGVGWVSSSVLNKEAGEAAGRWPWPGGSTATRLEPLRVTAKWVHNSTLSADDWDLGGGSGGRVTDAPNSTDLVHRWETGPRLGSSALT